MTPKLRDYLEDAVAVSWAECLRDSSCYETARSGFTGVADYTDQELVDDFLETYETIEEFTETHEYEPLVLTLALLPEFINYWEDKEEHYGAIQDSSPQG